MKKITTGIVAHVDAGKTTLSEALLYTAGNLRTLGRVDNGDAFLDTDQLEKKRGITILLSGQDVAKTLAVSDKALFLENGRGSVLTRTQFAAHGFQLDSLSLSGKKQGN